MAWRPEASLVSHGWTRSSSWVLDTGPLITSGLLHVLFWSMEKLRRMREALSGPPPKPLGRSCHMA
jgi:hypothetical protein